MCMGGDDLTDYRPAWPEETDDAAFDEAAEDDGCEQRDEPEMWR